MRLKDSPGKEFNLTIIGYEFPKIENDYWESNWLIINIQVVNQQGSWERNGPFLLTFEVEGLARWLDTVAVEAPMINRETLKETGEPHFTESPNLRLYDDAEFMEPNLRFQLVERTHDYAVIRIYFELEARPPWAPMRPFEIDDDEYWLDLRVSNADLKSASQSLHTQLLKYPVRATG